jgi:hypothetical protein
MTGFLDGIGKLSEPLTKLVEVTANGIGRYYEPTRITCEAKANAEAKEIELKSKIELSNIERRSKLRVEYRERLRQENIEKVVSLSSEVMPDSVSEDPVDIDWTLQYFDIIQDVCDEDMQTLWSKILAGEVSKPGSYSKRTLYFLKTLDKKDAMDFFSLCSFVFKDETGSMFVLEDEFTLEIMSQKVVDSNGLYLHLSSVGLISEKMDSTCENFDGLTIDYFGDKYLGISNGYKASKGGGIPKLNYPFHFRKLTQVAEELFSIVNALKVDNYFDDLSIGFAKRYKLSFQKQI